MKPPRRVLVSESLSCSYPGSLGMRDQAEWPYFGTWIGDSSALKSFP